MEFWSRRSTGGKIAIVVVLVTLLAAVLALGIFQGGIMGSGSSGRQAGATIPMEAALATATSGGGAHAPAEVLPANAPVPPTQPDKPAATANTQLNIHAGPGQTYPLIGGVNPGQPARIVGRSPDGQWWAIDFPTTFDGLGWISAGPVIAVNTGNLPVIEPAPPAALTGWRGEYFNNRGLQGQPVMVRNDAGINFDLGNSPPAQGVPGTDWSARWSRRVGLGQGVYIFRVNVEGGVRVWVDGVLLIDSWQAQGFRALAVESPALASGEHDIRVEYSKAGGNGSLSVRGERKLEPRPPKAIINGATRVQIGQAANLNAKNFQVFEGSHIESYLWDFGDGATGSGVYVTHIYERTGFYEVRLTVTDDKGFSDMDRHSLEVTEAPVPPEAEQPPQAVINAPGEGLVNQSILFDASKSRSTNPIASYAWEFGDSTAADAFQVNKAYSAAGIYNVTLTLTDEKGLQSAAQKQIRIVQSRE